MLDGGDSPAGSTGSLRCGLWTRCRSATPSTIATCTWGRGGLIRGRNFTSRVDIARHGFASVTLQLTQDYRRLKRIAAVAESRSRQATCARVAKHFGAEPETTHGRGARSWSRRPRCCCAKRPVVRRRPLRERLKNLRLRHRLLRHLIRDAPLESPRERERRSGGLRAVPGDRYAEPRRAKRRPLESELSASPKSPAGLRGIESCQSDR